MAEHQTGKHRAVVAIRERNGWTLPFVFRGEDESIETIRQRVETDSTVYADEATVWDALHAQYNAKRINHSLAFSDDGACTNQVESYFSLPAVPHGDRPTSPRLTAIPVSVCE